MSLSVTIERMLTRAEAAEYVGFSLVAFHKAVSTGRITPDVPGRGRVSSLFSLATLDAFAAENKPLKKWTGDEERRLRDLYGSDSTAPLLGGLNALAKEMGRHPANLVRKARTLGLSVNQSRRKAWEHKNKPSTRTKEELARMSSEAAKRRIAERGHPRGMLGKTHTPEFKLQQSKRSRDAWRDPNSKLNSPEAAQKRSDAMVKNVLAGKMNRGYTRTRGGKRADLGDRYFRSSWEANYARYLNWMVKQNQIASWDYECKTFVFERIKRGTRCYTPDFKVVKLDGSHEWHEVKGWMDQPSRTRLDRMARYYPEETVLVIGADWFKAARRNIAPLIPNWEKG